MKIETTRKENDWEHKFHVDWNNDGMADEIEVIMNDTDRGGISAEWKEVDGWSISADYWFGDGDRLPHQICFSAEKMIPTKDEDGFEDHDWIQAEITVELWGRWESSESHGRVEVHVCNNDSGIDKKDVPTDVAIAIAADIREACYRIYSEKRECVKI